MHAYGYGHMAGSRSRTRRPVLWPCSAVLPGNSPQQRPNGEHSSSFLLLLLLRHISRLIEEEEASTPPPPADLAGACTQRNQPAGMCTSYLDLFSSAAHTPNLAVIGIYFFFFSPLNLLLGDSNWTALIVFFLIIKKLKAFGSHS